MHRPNFGCIFTQFLTGRSLTVQSRNEAYKNSAKLYKNSRSDQGGGEGARTIAPPLPVYATTHGYGYLAIFRSDAVNDKILMPSQGL